MSDTHFGQAIFAPLPVRDGKTALSIVFNPSQDDPDLRDALASIGWLPVGGTLVRSPTWKFRISGDTMSVAWDLDPEDEPFYSREIDPDVLEIATRQRSIRAVLLKHNPRHTTLGPAGLAAYVRHNTQLQILLPIVVT